MHVPFINLSIDISYLNSLFWYVIIPTSKTNQMKKKLIIATIVILTIVFISFLAYGGQRMYSKSERDKQEINEKLTSILNENASLKRKLSDISDQQADYSSDFNDTLDETIQEQNDYLEQRLFEIEEQRQSDENTRINCENWGGWYQNGLCNYY